MQTLQKRLVLDTSTAYLYLGLFEGNRNIKTFYEEGNNDHSVKLMDELAGLFESVSFGVRDLDVLIVGIGPGSYTGLRIGVVVAKMLGWTLNIPVHQVSSLALLASSHKEAGIILPWIDARRGHAFLGLYERKNGIIKRINKDMYAHFETVKNDLKEAFVAINKGEPDMGALFESDLILPVDDIDLLAPVYLRQTEAERKRDKQ